MKWRRDRVVDRPHEYLLSVLNELRKIPNETAWVEFKQNKAEPDEVDEYISALSNSAALMGKVNAWMVWGIDDSKHDLTGTTFVPALSRVGSEELVVAPAEPQDKFSSSFC